MTQPAVAQPSIEAVGRMVGPAVAAVESLFGATLTASSPTQVDALPAGAGDGAAVRVPLTGPTGAGSITVIVPTSGHDLDPTLVAEAMIGGAAASLTELTGAAFQAGAGEQLADPYAPEGPATIVQFDVGTPDGPRLVMTWVVDLALDAPPHAETEPAAAAPANGAKEVAAATLPELTGQIGHGAARDLNLLSDVPMDVTVELGKAVLQVRDLLSLREGSVVELDRSAGAAVDVLVNGTLIARGDVVVIDDDLGVRVTEIVRR